MNKRLVTWEDIELVALALGAKWATVRQWVHRGTIPARWELRLRDYFGEAFIISDKSGRIIRGKSGRDSGKARPSLASYVLRYVRPEKREK